MGCRSPADRAFEALQTQYRRHLLLALLEENPRADEERDPRQLLTENGLGDNGEMERIRRHHIHLPKLQSLGYIQWNSETGRISKGQRWDELAPLLKLIRNQRDELPDDWL